jgi:hypothetical protein
MTTPQRETSHGKEVSGEREKLIRDIIAKLTNAYYGSYRYDRPNDSTEQISAFCRDLASNDVDELIALTRTDTIEEIGQAIPKIDHADNPFQSGRLEAFSEVRTILTEAKGKH